MGVRNVLLLVSTFFTLALLYYYYSGLGGPLLLASYMVPLSFIIFVLNSILEKSFYPSLPEKVRYAIASIYIALSIIVAIYLVTNFYALITVRSGSYNVYDIIIGLIIVALVMEYARIRHRVIFYLNLFLIFYAIFGYVFPPPLNHPGITPERIITSLSVEYSDGVLGKLPQLALTLIGSFLLMVNVAIGFGMVRSIVQTIVSKLAKKPRLIPQTAVISSMLVAMVSGSGAANAATTGSVTIPLMRRIGLLPEVAAAVETAASLGGQLMPPMMGISAFLMADFLGTSYIEVMKRGFIPAFIYYIGVAIAVYFISKKFVRKVIAVKEATREEIIDTVIFLSAIALLVYLMGILYYPPMYAALLVTALIFVTQVILKFSKLRVSLEHAVLGFATATADLTLLLANLGIMSATFTITGIPTKVGEMIVASGGNVFLIALLAFIFGYVVGLGLPPSVTYLLTALVIFQPMLRAGLDPWAIHFYAFLIGVFSELSPPTSVTAAVASRIAEADFIKTMNNALRLCVPLYILMISVIVHPSMVSAMDPLPAILTLVSTILASVGINMDNKKMGILLTLIGLAILFVPLP